MYREHSTFPEEHLMNSLRPFDPASWSGPAAPYDTLRPFALVFITGLLAWVPWFGIDRRVRLLFAWFLFVSVIVLVIPLKFGDFSIWKSLFGRLPGFSVIRDPGRIIPLYELAVVAVVALFISPLSSRSLLRKGITALVFLLLVVQWNPEVFDFGRPRGVYDQWVEAPIEIDRIVQVLLHQRRVTGIHVAVVSHVGALQRGCNVHFTESLDPDIEWLQRVEPDWLGSRQSTGARLRGGCPAMD